MKPAVFSEIVKKRLIRCEFVLSPKGEEYSRGGDRLHNFKKASEILGCSPEEALVGMWIKHVVSICDMIRDMEGGQILPDAGLIDEKFTDAINYLLLLEALIEERRQAA